MLHHVADISSEVVLVETPGGDVVANLPERYAPSQMKRTNPLIDMQSKLLQSFQSYSMLIFHVPTESYVEIVDDTVNPLQIMDSTMLD